MTSPAPVPEPLALPREAALSPRGVVAQNLLYARNALDITQQELADTSGVSRATIAQLEAGVGDPRLSTLEALAATLHVPVHFLLLDQASFRALAELSAGVPQNRPPSSDRVMRVLRVGGALSRQRAASLGVDVARDAGLTADVHRVGAAIGAARLADPGIVLGAHWAELLERYKPVPAPSRFPHEGEFVQGDGI
jgi:transcriptional regulator with XRE-family HTH domain